MTKKEALLGVINYPLPGFENAIEKALIDAGINGEEKYTSDAAQAVDLAAAEVILFVDASAGSISNNGLSVNKGTREGLLKIRSLILQKYGLEETDDGKANIYGDSEW